MASPTPNFDKAMQEIDAAHSEDPKKITVNGTEVAYELHYAQKSSAYLSTHTPTASPNLQLAVRAQHFRRWEVPRSSYPMTKIGYHAWRTHLKKRQAALTSAILVECGYGAADAARVAALIEKQGLKEGDAEAQALEDVACLVFLDDQFEEFRAQHDEGKILGILRKTWGKMGERGREMALEMRMEDGCRELVEKALAG